MLANIHRPGALTPSVVLSLGLGLALLVTLLQIDGNLRRQFVAALPDKAPSVFFVDIQDADAARFDAFARRAAPEARYERVPMLRGRIVSAHGVRAEELKAPPNAAWVLQSDRGITYANEMPAGSRVVAGEWWKPDYQGPPLVSFENKIAEGLGLKIGDPVVVNVLGRNITATLANLRTVDWQSLGINFVLVFSPGTFPRRAAYPHRDPDLSRAARRSSRRSRCSRRRGRIPDRDRGARARSARCGRQGGVRPDAGDPRRQRGHADRGRAGARRRARRPATATASTTPSC